MSEISENWKNHSVTPNEAGTYCTRCLEPIVLYQGNSITKEGLVYMHQARSSVDLHTRIVDLLIANFLPQTKDFDPTNNLLVRRGVSSVTDDILRLVEDHYGVKQ